jgi:hypothetical protein
MLHNELIHIPHITLLRSDKILNFLIDKLKNSHKDIEKNSYKIIENGVRDFYPNRYRFDEIELTINQKELNQSDIKKDFNFSFLEKLFDNFYDIDGSKIYAKEDNLESYISLITKITPYQIIGYKLSKLLFYKDLKLCDILNMVDEIKPLGYKVDENKKYAENHLHLKGVGYTPFHLVNLFIKPTDKKFYKFEFINQLPRINEFSFLNNYQYSIAQLIDIGKLSIDYIYGSLLDDEKKEYKNYILKLQKILTINRPMGLSFKYSIEKISQMKKIYNFFKSTVEDSLIFQIINFYDKKEFDKAYLIESILLFYLLEKSNDSITKTFIKIYLQINNILRSYMLMSQNLGLAHFSEFNGSQIRDIISDTANNTTLNIIDSGTNYLNAKMGIRDKDYKIAESINIFKDAFDKNSKNRFFKYNFSLSVTKGKEKEKKIKVGDLPVKFFDKRKELEKQTFALDDFLRNSIYKHQNSYSSQLKFNPKKAFENKFELKKDIYNLSDLVVSIDAVGKETHTPPEVFTPFFRYLRRDIKPLKNSFAGLCNFKQHKKLLITVHSGEDFNHIITGIRQIDESIKFFDMKKNDRLGHALAIGIKPKHWLKSVKDLAITKGEYFDNLVWLVYSLNDISKKYLKVHHYVKKYEMEVLELFKEIYEEYSGETPQIFDLYKAWELRGNCPIKYFDKKREKTLFDDYSNTVLDMKIYDKNYKKSHKNSLEIFEMYQVNKKVREEYKKSYPIDKNRIDDDEMEMWEVLQDYLINKCAEKGIIIEVNPSSNVFISSISEYKNHPLFRWSPLKDKHLKNGKRYNKFSLRNGKIAICINSDDPSIFATTIQNEFNILKKTAIKSYKSTDKEVKEWLEDFRKFGIEIFKESDSGRVS